MSHKWWWQIVLRLFDAQSVNKLLVMTPSVPHIQTYLRMTPHNTKKPMRNYSTIKLYNAIYLLRRFETIHNTYADRFV